MAQTSHAASAKAGSVRFVQKASNSEFDKFTDEPVGGAQQQTMRGRYSGHDRLQPLLRLAA